MNRNSCSIQKIAIVLKFVWVSTIFCTEISLRIPILDMKGTEALCYVEILDIDDQVIATKKKKFFASSDSAILAMNVKLSSKISDPDLLRARISYYTFKQIFSLPQIHNRMILRVLGEKEFIKNTPVFFHFFAREYLTDEPLPGVAIEAGIKDSKSFKKKFTGVTNSLGNCDISFLVSDSLDEAEVFVKAISKLGTDSFTTTVRFIGATTTYLVTDKPIYQPGQTIHIRSLSLKRPKLYPLKNEKLTFEIEDSKSNKIFKKEISTDEFGTAYVNFLLADELNFGDYKIRVIHGKEVTEKSVKIERYVLPKFKISAVTDKEFYAPGNTIKGDLDVQYFFGKPVASAKVKITGYKYDVEFHMDTKIDGQTDDKGKYHFSYKLPDYFSGLPLEQGNAFIRLDIEVIDKANHSEKITVKKKVVGQPIELFIVPEGTTIKPMLENKIYVIARYADGSPCRNAKVSFKAEQITATANTDSFGIAEFGVIPANSQVDITVSVTDNKGEKASTNQTFSAIKSPDQIILRTSGRIFKVGQSIPIQVYTTNKKRGVIFLDVVKNNQIMLTQSVKVVDNVAQYMLPLDASLSGSIWIHAYMVSTSSNIVSDSRLCYVNSADDLSIKISSSKSVYGPAENGEINFLVTDKVGKPVAAALCVAIVDEAIFAVSQLQPGLEKVYFTLERQLLSPRYEFHGFAPEQIVHMDKKEPTTAENVMFLPLDTKEFFLVNYTTQMEGIVKKIRYSFLDRLEKTEMKINKACGIYFQKYKKYPANYKLSRQLIEEGLLREEDLLDPWGREYRIIEEYYYSDRSIVSAGPDGKFNTEDDIRYNRRIAQENEPSDMVKTVPPRDIMNMALQAMNFSKMSSSAGKKKSLVADRKELPVEGLADEPRVREFFPETFLFEPSLITDAKGKAQLSLTMPDAITSWRVTALGSSIIGQLGSTISEIKVFQDFFVDIDLPIALTEGDEISIPVALYNYLPQKQAVTLKLEKQDWFDITGDSVIVKELEKDEICAVYFPIKVKKIGAHSLLVKAYGKIKSDAIRRTINVLPDGLKCENIVADRLSKNVTKQFDFPANAIANANSLIFRIFPSTFSQMVEGLEQMLQVPYGCFEQTSSVTYPNILILDYLKKTKKSNPEIEMQAQQYISLGYQRLLSFEVDGGGFSWFGDAPANKILTAYGLMEFVDMSKVYDIDERLIERTVQWLKSRQELNGSWKPDKIYLHLESWGRIQDNELLPTAYICWALGEASDKSEHLLKGLDFLRQKWTAATDPYEVAIIANAFVSNQPKSKITEEVLAKLIDMAENQKDAIYWKSNMKSFTFSQDEGANIETSGLAAYALARNGKHFDETNKALNYLIRAKSSNGLWHTTQGTIIVLKAMLAAMMGKQENVEDVVVKVKLNGKNAAEVVINNSNSDVVQQIDLTPLASQQNQIDISVNGTCNMIYEIKGGYYLRWNDVLVGPKQPFTISVEYDRTQLAVNDIITSKVEISNKKGRAQMVIVDLGIPPGFEVLTPTLDELVDKVIKKYSLISRQIIIYIDEISAGKPIVFSYALKARYPIRAKVRESMVYEYYNTKQRALKKPVDMIVRMK